MKSSGLRALAARGCLCLVGSSVGCGDAADNDDGATDSAVTTTVGTSTTTGPTTEATGSTTTTDAGSSTTGTDESTATTLVEGTSGSSSSGEPLATCDGISDFIAGASPCRTEETRCSLEIPAATTCAATCETMGRTCLRAYPESESCVPAVYLDGIACDAPTTEASFCQCGDPTLTHPEALVVTIGDSTMDNTGVPGESGWGNEFPPFALRPEDIHNQGSSGASSLDFETRQNWPMAQALLGPNVYLLIQFGHNDTSDDPNRHTEPGVPPEYDGTYHERLLFYVEAARSAGATPVILTSLGTMTFDGDGMTTTGSLGEYVLSARKFAEDEGLMLFDANRASRGEFERLGPEQTIALYSFDETTHFTPAGATRMAELTVRLGCVESEAFCAQFSPL